jgi:hypothetical protein
MVQNAKKVQITTNIKEILWISWEINSYICHWCSTWPPWSWICVPCFQHPNMSKEMLGFGLEFLVGFTQLPTLSKKNSKFKFISPLMIILWRIKHDIMMFERDFLSLKRARPRTVANQACNTPKALCGSSWHASWALSKINCFFVLGVWMAQMFTNEGRCRRLDNTKWCSHAHWQSSCKSMSISISKPSKNIRPAHWYHWEYLSTQRIDARTTSLWMSLLQAQI